MRFWLPLLCLLLATHPAQAGKADRLAGEARKLAESVDEIWQALLDDHEEVSDEDLQKLIDVSGKAADLYGEVLELEDRAGIDDRIVRLSRRIQAALQLRAQRAAAAGGEVDPTAPPEQAGPTAAGTAPKPPGSGVSERDRQRQERGTRTQKLPPTTAEAFAKVPVPEETRRQQLRHESDLRKFILNYAAARRLGTLVTRCTNCNGSGRIGLGKRGRDGKAIYLACRQCYGEGAHLNSHAARKAFWLSKSPYYRAKEINRARFEEKLKKWGRKPTSIREFLRKVKLESVEYHGLWAMASYTEYVRKVHPRKKKLTREVNAYFIRIGRRWFFFDARADREFLEAHTPH